MAQCLQTVSDTAKVTIAALVQQCHDWRSRQDVAERKAEINARAAGLYEV